MNRSIIKIASVFSRTPGPRYVWEGINSGELFREKLLAPAFEQALNEGKKLVVNLDGAAGYGTSFLEEAFGGLIRQSGFDYHQVVSNLEIVSTEEPHWIEAIQGYLSDAYAETRKAAA